MIRKKIIIKEEKLKALLYAGGKFGRMICQSAHAYDDTVIQRPADEKLRFCHVM